MARSGLGKPDKPIGSFLFSGPTGVGKTEVAKQLAFTMGIELIRFDMSEYMERHAVEPPDRRAAGLRRLRPGRPADRGDQQEAACGAAAGRDRKGASRHLQHPVAGDGPRHADRQQRSQGRFPQRHHRHDDQCRRRNAAAPGDRFSNNARGRRRDGRDQAHVHAGVPQPARRDHLVQVARRRSHPARGRQVPDAARRPVAREEGRHQSSPTRCASTWPRRASIR